MPDEAWFNVNMMQKDMLLALELGRQVDVPLPTTAVANEFLTAARAMGLAEQDFAVIFRGAGANVRSNKMTTAVRSVQDRSCERRAELWLHMYRRMMAIRLFEEQVNDLYTRALMPGLAHLYIGEEAVAVGVCEALRPDDYITSTHRGHGHCLAKGAAPDRMFAELLGKEAGYCKGKGGSMHIADPDTGNLGANAIVGGSAGIATGAAFSAKRLGNGQRRGLLLRRRRAGTGRALRSDEHGGAVEAAGDLRLREQYVQRVHALFGDHRGRHSDARQRLRRASRRASTGRTCARSTPTAKQLVERARKGEGPSFLLCNTYRYTGITSATSAANITAPSRKSRSGRPSAIRSRLLGRLADRRRSSPIARSSDRIQTEVKAEMEQGGEVRARRALSDARRSGARRICLNEPMPDVAVRELTLGRSGPRSARRRDAPRSARLPHGRRRGRSRHGLQGAHPAWCRSSAPSA